MGTPFRRLKSLGFHLRRLNGTGRKPSRQKFWLQPMSLGSSYPDATHWCLNYNPGCRLWWVQALVLVKGKFWLVATGSDWAFPRIEDALAGIARGMKEEGAH